MAGSVESLCQRARQAIAQGQIEQARQLYLQALGLKSDAPDVHYGLATACFLLNDLDSAAYHFKEVTRLDPLRPGAYINLGAVYNRLGEFEEAVQTLRRGIQLDPHRGEGYYNLGLVYRNMGQPNLAVQAYIEATRIDNQMVDAHFNLGNLYLETGRYKQAIAHYKTALSLRPRWDKAMNGLAQAEAAIAAAEPRPAATPMPEPKSPAATAASNDDLARLVDPEIHGDLLTILHHAAVDSEAHGKQFLQIVEHHIEPAIKDLSTRLLGVDSGGPDLNQCIAMFENALDQMRKAQQDLDLSIDRVRTLGNQLTTGQQEGQTGGEL
jgi:tetratricopeptide (TPR) repeat protein